MSPWMSLAARTRRSRLSPLAVDTVVALVLLVLLIGSFGGEPRPGQRPVDGLSWVLALALNAPFVLHRRWPAATLAVVLGSFLAFSALHYGPYPGVSVFATLFAVTLHGRRRFSVLAFGTTLVAMVLALALQPPGIAEQSDWAASLLSVAVAWLAADNQRQRRIRWAALEERTRLLEQEREDRDRAAVTAERLRIARELHDVVAHSMSVIVVQAGMGRGVIDADPAQAREALVAIETTSRSAMGEMRRLLGVLREGDDAPGLAPAPGLGELDRLLAQTRGLGLGVTLEGTGVHAELPPGAGLTAYRIVQESLTNVIKHGGPAARVRLERTDDGISIEVTDQGRPGAPQPRSGAGQGLIGMRERVAVYGGEFDAARRPGGGFRVYATVPYAARLS